MFLSYCFIGVRLSQTYSELCVKSPKRTTRLIDLRVMKVSWNSSNQMKRASLLLCSFIWIGWVPCQHIFRRKSSDFIETKLRHGFSLVNLLHIFRTPFPKNISGGLLLIRLSFSTDTFLVENGFWDEAT